MPSTAADQRPDLAIAGPRRSSRPLLSHLDLDGAETAALLRLTDDYASRPGAYQGLLEGLRVGLLFTAVSTRTRTAFWRAAVDFGAKVLSLGAEDLQLRTGETWADTGMVLSQHLDAVVVRTNGPIGDMRQLAQHLPGTVNALSHEEHPTQALADYCAIRQHFGKVEGTRIAYFGEGNNTAAALALLMTAVRGVRCDFYCPPGYGLAHEVAAAAASTALRTGARLRTYDRVPERPDPVDVVYTTRWESMGVMRDGHDWRAKFAPFRVTRSLLERLAASERAVFMHDLPAVRGEEVSSDVLDGERSIVRSQARHKRSAAGGALLWSLGFPAFAGDPPADRDGP